MSASIVKVENLSHRYSVQWAIKDINFELTRNGIYGLLGSNGAGKSTIMNIMCGVIKQTQGEVYIQGVNLRQEPVKAKRHIGFLPQQPPLATDLTVEEYLRHCANIRLMEANAIKPAIDEVMSKVGVSHFSKRLIRNLSGGYQQRVGIAQAIIHKPRLVVMDEPTNGLDPNQLIEARKLIREIAKDCTILLSSHVMSEIHLLCREVIMVESGRIVFSDSMDAFNNYLKPNTLLLKMENAPPTQDLLKVKGVSRAELLSDKQFRIYFEGDQDISERIVAASVEHDWRLREINFEKGLLDDVFKQLSTQSHQ